MGSIIVDVSKGHQSMGRQDSVLRGKGKEKLNVYVDQSQPLDKDCIYYRILKEEELMIIRSQTFLSLGYKI